MKKKFLIYKSQRIKFNNIFKNAWEDTDSNLSKQFYVVLVMDINKKTGNRAKKSQKNKVINRCLTEINKTKEMLMFFGHRIMKTAFVLWEY